MVNKNKIILMAKMAVYDKCHGNADRAVYSYFRRDYIYRKNMWTRAAVAVGSMFLLVLYWLHQIFIYGLDIREIDIQQGVLNSILFLGAVIAFYTLIGTIQGTHQYYKVQKRMERYLALIQRLERTPDHEDPALLYEEENKTNKRRKRA